jgi:hypothetical protein
MTSDQDEASRAAAWSGVAMRTITNLTATRST